ncbi:MAG: 2-succinyl-5-enolpyruvyl-6-hydroxy-3-cyclohexene-1-carboxylic-acid synthase [Opitutus sp.]|nr:2-succinyl-5-enolpyruvyl-6-hydroxy-3-cyclohexene-1-carboxylic-acid synthase [Opitutus sp.]MCS6248492.1 2-succinyl-5-enolpyruvyl-6-hydroxy-3-cyclohexene-1-carboxylic-acid synthase [Opitutus sp.]MCS6274683.1 2-succinyl-5-enolpyruvyl-6-hydroxy-3-cyclohexene-1-carboxylic-acid synthase [Opitutus sp.]MCS6275889.1 2-succinyl-5-enolpyruvyl-6-hydroxy-3-cyclohexene-1-carboxylic-acid synthase [Opitutus sp.]MCS6300985.1 2-succinyl-5-enolpyruvyl-6-hydroxy-3-cyclohexene-1-carboxylic-acid synthase [Opitutu
MTPLDFRNTNTLWCSVLVETLVRGGVAQAVVSPGSRSTPLTMALVRHPAIEAVPVLDERSAAFFALGLAKQSQRPVVLVCTSGSAGAHYLPAIIEAQESAIPLIVITADRPPELRDCASGQTIDQQKLFGGFVGFYHELAVPETNLELLRYLRQTLVHAVERALAVGPVHLNAPFRDPLAPIEDDSAKGLVGAQDWDRFFALPHLATEPALLGNSLAMPPPQAQRVVVIAGNDWPHDHIVRWAAARDWPVLADVLSPARLRHGGGTGVVVAAYDAILRDPRAVQALQPDVVFVLGEIPTSKSLRAWLGAVDAQVVQVTQKAGNRDGVHGRTLTLRLPPTALDSVAADWPAAPTEWAARWAQAEVAAQAVLVRCAEVPGFEGAFTRTLAETLTREQVLCVASSMPVRDLEYFAPVRTDGPRVFGNRGANGIDGTLSTALGVAHGGSPTVLLTGDLALLHDTNGFLVAAKLRGSLTVVLINNQGGGIFGHLPVARFNPPFEEFWATPQTVDFARLCAAYGVAHHGVKTPSELRGLLLTEVGKPGLRVIEVHTDRTHDVATRQCMLKEAAQAAGDTLA